MQIKSEKYHLPLKYCRQCINVSLHCVDVSGLRVQQQTPQQPGPNTTTTTVPTQSTPLKTDGSTPKQPSFETPPAAPTTTTTTNHYCDEVKTIMKKLEGLSEEEVIKKVVPVIEGLDSQPVIQELVGALSEKALDDPLFSCIAAKISQKLWDNESIHQFVRNPLLSRTQSLYSRRKELATAGRYHGLCVYVSELFRVLRVPRVVGIPLRPMCLPVVELMTGLMTGLLKGGGAPSEQDVQCFYQQMMGIGAIIMECMQVRVVGD